MLQESLPDAIWIVLPPPNVGGTESSSSPQEFSENQQHRTTYYYSSSMQSYADSLSVSTAVTFHQTSNIINEEEKSLKLSKIKRKSIVRGNKIQYTF